MRLSGLRAQPPSRIARCVPPATGIPAQTARIKQLVDEGKDHDTILAAFVNEYGQHVRDVPERNSGFNRLAWLLPYLLAGVGLVVIIMNARRWSHAPRCAAGGGAGAAGPRAGRPPGR